jgi:hypothetical protein
MATDLKHIVVSLVLAAFLVALATTLRGLALLNGGGLPAVTRTHDRQKTLLQIDHTVYRRLSLAKKAWTLLSAVAGGPPTCSAGQYTLLPDVGRTASVAVHFALSTPNRAPPRA